MSCRWLERNPERDGQAQNARAGQQGADVDEDIEGEQQPDHDDRHLAHAAQQLGDGLAPLFPLGQGGVVAVVHRHLDPAGDQVHDAEGDVAEDADDGDAQQVARQLRGIDLEHLGELAEPVRDGEQEEMHERPRGKPADVGRGRNLGATARPINPPGHSARRSPAATAMKSWLEITRARSKEVWNRASSSRARCPSSSPSRTPGPRLPPRAWVLPLPAGL